MREKEKGMKEWRRGEGRRKNEEKRIEKGVS